MITKYQIGDKLVITYAQEESQMKYVEIIGYKPTTKEYLLGIPNMSYPIPILSESFDQIDVRKASKAEIALFFKPKVNNI